MEDWEKPEVLSGPLGWRMTTLEEKEREREGEREGEREKEREKERERKQRACDSKDDRLQGRQCSSDICKCILQLLLTQRLQCSCSLIRGGVTFLAVRNYCKVYMDKINWSHFFQNPPLLPNLPTYLSFFT